MTLTVTLIVLAVAIAVLAVSLLMARRPYVPGRPPLLPPVAVQFVAVTVVLLMLAHLMTLLTGQPLVGRNG